MLVEKEENEAPWLLEEKKPGCWLARAIIQKYFGENSAGTHHRGVSPAPVC